MNVQDTVTTAPTSLGAQLDELLEYLLLVDGESIGKCGEQERAQVNIQEQTVDDWADRVLGILMNRDSNDDEHHGSIESAGLEEIKRIFDKWELERKRTDEQKEFKTIETFIHEEQSSGCERRKKARVLQASKEVQMASEIAQLKGLRLRVHSGESDADLQNKISDTERTYLQRRMITAKSAQLANGDCRLQFTRVKSFFESLHLSRKTSLRRSYERSLKVMAITHRLCETDSRVIALEQNCAERVYRSNESNLNELHMAQNLEEAAYLDAMFELLDRVQTAKETATTELFLLNVKDLKECKKSASRRDQEMDDLQAEATLEMAKMMAHYVTEQSLNIEDESLTKDKVAAMERKKELRTDPTNAVASVSELYDTIIWQVATSHLGLSTTGTSLYTESIYGDGMDWDEEKDEEGNSCTDGGQRVQSPELDESDPQYLMRSDEVDDSHDNCEKRLQDDGSALTGSTSNTTSSENDLLSVLGNIHVKQLRKDLASKEQSLLKKHKAEGRKERMHHRKTSRDLKVKHQRNIDMILRLCVDERQRLREGITQRMNDLVKNQELSTKTLQDSIEQDIKSMQDAWAEHKRLEDAEKKSFDKAQALISAQVFHEVRNALSSVIAMSEMTSTLQEDSTITHSGLMSSVNEMLDQSQEIVRYSLTMLNNILDLNKIKTGSFEMKKEAFDLTDLMQRATTMQLVKAQARGVKMKFQPPKERCVAYTDKDIVSRVVTNFISNAVKFTSSGAIQPFILPAEALMPSASAMDLKEHSLQGHRFKLVAVGVADTGCGLSQKNLDKAKSGLSCSGSQGKNTHGAKNSGFGLHLAHQLSGTLETQLQLTDLSKCHGVLNDDIAHAFKLHQSNIALANGGSSSIYGTVLYFVIPVLEDAYNPYRSFSGAFPSTTANNGSVIPESSAYRFSPQPSKESTDDRFRILVADDVLMLRKGLVRSMLQVFEEKVGDCRVSIHTSCTAEDTLRMMSSQPFDLVISDNQFAPPTDLRALGTHDARPQILSDGESKLQKRISDFFCSESFTIEEGDGELSGLQALLQLLDSSDQPHPNPTPILILLSGHKFQLDPTCGIIIVQKPLRTSEIVPLLEAHAQRLVEAGLCFEEEDGSGETYRVVNQRGAQIFRRATK